MNSKIIILLLALVAMVLVWVYSHSHSLTKEKESDAIELIGGFKGNEAIDAVINKYPPNSFVIESTYLNSIFNLTRVKITELKLYQYSLYNIKGSLELTFLHNNLMLAEYIPYDCLEYEKYIHYVRGSNASSKYRDNKDASTSIYIDCAHGIAYESSEHVMLTKEYGWLVWWYDLVND